MAHFLKSFDNLDNEPDAVLNAYRHHCSLTMSCAELARATHDLACQDAETCLPRNHAKRINALLTICGMYDAVGVFACRIGLAGKSGVGGGIIAVLPEKYSICVWAPGLDASGNSVVGTRALDRFVQLTGGAIF